MPIRLATNCTNCNNFTNESTCAQHNIKVSERHTCDSFSMQDTLKEGMSCGTCTRFNTVACPHRATPSQFVHPRQRYKDAVLGSPTQAKRLVPLR